MIGDTRVVGGVEFEVIWDGGEGLIPDRVTKVTDLWEGPKRIYNKKSDYWTTLKKGSRSGQRKTMVLLDRHGVERVEPDSRSGDGRRSEEAREPTAIN